MALKQLLTNLEEGTTAGVVDSHPFHAQFNNGGSQHGNSTSIFDTFNFNQRSFKFGKGNAYDRPRQGFSREPFIGKNQEIPDLDKEASRFLGFIDSFSDGFVRGGITTAISRSAKDVARLTKFFLSQRGIGFLTQQLALQATQPDILAGSAGGKIGEFISGLTGLDLNNNRTFNVGLNILGQAAVNFTGVHLNRSGLSPIWQDSQTYSKLAVNLANDVGELQNNTLHSKNTTFKRLGFSLPGNNRGNRLLTLFAGRMVTDGAVNIDTSGNRTKVGKLFNKIGDTIKDLTGESGNSILYEYDKGPGSIYGLGKTTIYRYQNSETPITYAEDGVDSDSKEYPLTIDVNGYQKLTLDSTTDLRTFGGFVNDRLDLQFGSEEEIHKGYRENRVGLGNPGNLSVIQTSLRTNRYDTFEETTQDKVNRLDVYNADLENANAENLDFIKFYFDVYKPGVAKAHRIVFRAFLDTFEDSFSGDWNKFNYAGRGEPFFTYNNFDRSINFSFKIAAQTRHEMKPLYRKLNYLASTTAPDYSSDGRMRGVFVRATIGDYLAGKKNEVCTGMPGFFNSINISWQKDYPWEIAMDHSENNMDSEVAEIPHVLDVSCRFTPIHDFIPEANVKNPFIVKECTDWFYDVADETMDIHPKDPQKPIKLTPKKPVIDNPYQPSGPIPPPPITGGGDDGGDYPSDGGGSFRPEESRTSKYDKKRKRKLKWDKTRQNVKEDIGHFSERAKYRLKNLHLKKLVPKFLRKRVICHGVR